MKQSKQKSEREMNDPTMHCGNGHLFTYGETGRGPIRVCPICCTDTHFGPKMFCKRCIMNDAMRTVGEALHVSTATNPCAASSTKASVENAANAAFIPVTLDTLIAIANAVERMPDIEFIKYAEECFLRVGPPRDASGRPIPMDPDSHESTMYHFVIPQLIARLWCKL